MKKKIFMIFCGLIIISYIYIVNSNNYVRVMSFNMQQFAGHSSKTQGSFIEKFKPHIVATQEVDVFTTRSNYDTALEFKNGGKFKDYYFSSQMKYQGGDYGLAMFSNFEILSRETIKIYSDEYLGEFKDEQLYLLENSNRDDEEYNTKLSLFKEKLKNNNLRMIEPNIIQKIVVKVNGKIISAYGVHLSYEDYYIREKQREQLIQILEDDKNEYKVVIGDFNADNGTYEYNYFIKNYNLANGKDGYWKDTFPRDLDENMKSYSIDNIIVTKNIDIKKVEYVETKYSDHTIIFADLILK